MRVFLKYGLGSQASPNSSGDRPCINFEAFTFLLEIHEALRVQGLVDMMLLHMIVKKTRDWVIVAYFETPQLGTLMHYDLIMIAREAVARALSGELL